MSQLTKTSQRDNEFSDNFFDNLSEQIDIGCIFTKFKQICCPPFNIIPRLVSFIAFQAPKPSTYSFHLNEETGGMTLEVNEEIMSYNRWYLRHRFNSFLKSIENFHLFFCCSQRGNRIAGYFIEAKYKTRLTILFSHNNSTDLGLRSQLCWLLSQKIVCNVIAYDYSGFGLSTGKPSEANAYSDIQCVFTYLNTKYNIHSNTTLLYGESIGSVPTIHLATRYHFLGVILESPILSGLRTILGKRVNKVFPFDPFPNITRIKSIDTKVLVMHGTDDQLVDIKDAILLYKRCKHKVEPFWAQNYPHNSCSLHPMFYRRINQFIELDLLFTTL